MIQYPNEIAVALTKRLVHNLRLETSSVSQVTIKAGSTVGSDDGSSVISLASDIIISITNSGANGLDTGSEASATLYYIWLIKNPSTGTVAGLFSLSDSAPTMPSGYTQKRLVGAVRNSSGGDFLFFKQIGGLVEFETPIALVNGSIPTSWTQVTTASFYPVKIGRALRLYQYAGAPTSGADITMRTAYSAKSGAGSNGLYRQYADVFSSAVQYTSVNYEQMTDESGVFSVFAGNQATWNSLISCVGFILDL